MTLYSESKFSDCQQKCCPKNYKEAFWGSVPATNWLLAPIKSRKTIQVTHDETKICPFLAKMLPAIIRGSILGFWDCYRSISHPILITISHPSGPLFELETCPFKAKILFVIPKWSILDLCESHQSISRSIPVKKDHPGGPLYKNLLISQLLPFNLPWNFNHV